MKLCSHTPPGLLPHHGKATNSLVTHTIAINAPHKVIVLQMAVPMTLFFTLMFFVVLFVGSRLRFPYRDAVAVAFNSTGRDFEIVIAIAIAITAFSPTVALATVVGPPIEVPAMLALVWAAMRLEPRLFPVRPAPSPAAERRP